MLISPSLHSFLFPLFPPFSALSNVKVILVTYGNSPTQIFLFCGCECGFSCHFWLLRLKKQIFYDKIDCGSYNEEGERLFTFLLDLNGDGVNLE